MAERKGIARLLCIMALFMVLYLSAAGGASLALCLGFLFAGVMFLLSGAWLNALEQWEEQARKKGKGKK